MTAFWTAEPDAVHLAVRVTPRARGHEVAGIVHGGDGREVLAVRLAAPPVDGAANRALIAFLAESLRVPRSAVAIVSGETSRLKIVRIEGLDVATLRARLGL